MKAIFLIPSPWGCRASHTVKRAIILRSSDLVNGALVPSDFSVGTIVSCNIAMHNSDEPLLMSELFCFLSDIFRPENQVVVVVFFVFFYNVAMTC